MNPETRKQHLLNLRYTNSGDYFNSEIEEGINLKTIPGRKSDDDRIIICVCPNCGNERWLLLEDWAKWGRMKGRIEDINYPPPKKGRYMLIELMDFVFKKEDGHWLYTIEECCIKTKISGY